MNVNPDDQAGTIHTEVKSYIDNKVAPATENIFKGVKPDPGYVEDNPQGNIIEAYDSNLLKINLIQKPDGKIVLSREEYNKYLDRCNGNVEEANNLLAKFLMEEVALTNKGVQTSQGIKTTVSNAKEVVGAETKIVEGSGKAVNLSDELAKSGVKYNPNDVVAITKTADGKLVWLENGNKQAGLEHIMNHADDFAAKGIARGEIKDLVMTALEKGEIVGYQGKGTGRPIYEVVFKGEKQRVAITVGNNGFVVGANPQSLP